MGLLLSPRAIVFDLIILTWIEPFLICNYFLQFSLLFIHWPVLWLDWPFPLENWVLGLFLGGKWCFVFLLSLLGFFVCLHNMNVDEVSILLLFLFLGLLEFTIYSLKLFFQRFMAVDLFFVWTVVPGTS